MRAIFILFLFSFATAQAQASGRDVAIGVVAGVLVGEMVHHHHHAPPTTYYVPPPRQPYVMPAYRYEWRSEDRYYAPPPPLVPPQRCYMVERWEGRYLMSRTWQCETPSRAYYR